VLLLALLLTVSALVSLPKVHSAEIKDLPGLNSTINFKQYSGYLTVDAKNARRLFYWFVESQGTPSQDPVVLWLNGGPGCSSLAGFLTEHGPFRPNQDNTLSLNPFSWNKAANVLYLESPAGVGFSYSRNTDDYAFVGDKRTADDAYKALLEFFSEYPQFSKRPFYVSGESYGGHYVPTLVQRIRQGNVENPSKPIALKGFLVGNAWTSMPVDNAGAVFYWWTHALISDETYQNIMATCDFTNIGPLVSGQFGKDPVACQQYLIQAYTAIAGINIYDIYVDVCNSNQKYIRQYANAGSPVHAAMLRVQEQITPPYQPCQENWMSNYLNLPAVRKAIHALDTSYAWTECSNIIRYNYSDVEKSVIPLYQEFFATNDLKILVFSGDVDAIVPVTGTRAWIATLNQKVERKWAPWTVGGQVGGFVTKYESFTFATVRQAGHMVPETQPERAFAMFSRFLASGSLDE